MAVSRKVTFQDFPKVNVNNILALKNPYMVGYSDTIVEGKYYERSFPLDIFITKVNISEYLDNYVTEDELSDYYTKTEVNALSSEMKDYVNTQISSISLKKDKVALLNSGIYIKGEESGLWYRLKINGLSGEEYLGFSDGESVLPEN